MTYHYTFTGRPLPACGQPPQAGEHVTVDLGLVDCPACRAILGDLKELQPEVIPVEKATAGHWMPLPPAPEGQDAPSASNAHRLTAPAEQPKISTKPPQTDPTP